jgi:SET domain-containing protein
LNKKLKINEGIYVKQSDTHGWGVFTNLDIKKGEIIEECVIAYNLIPLHSNVLLDYRYVWPSIKNYNSYCIALGFGSIYNHSNENNNIDWEINEEKRMMTFTAIKDIKINEELMFNYQSEEFH